MSFVFEEVREREGIENTTKLRKKKYLMNNRVEQKKSENVRFCQFQVRFTNSEFQLTKISRSGARSIQSRVKFEKTPFSRFSHPLSSTPMALN